MNSDYIKDYLLSKKELDYKLSSDGTEFMIPSIFLKYDPKRHMSINLDTGLWRCFKTGNSGSFFKLYSIMEKVTYKKAYEKFIFYEILEPQVKNLKQPSISISTDIKEDFSNFTLIDWAHEPKTELETTARIFLMERYMNDCKLDFYVANQGDHCNRLIIPFLKDNGEVFFYQSRSLYNNDTRPKYLNYRGYKASDVLFPYKYDSLQPLFICEGVFDALSVRNVNLNATTTLSCSISEAQVEQLKHYGGDIVIAFDNDEAGRLGLSKYNALRNKYRLKKFKYVFPPEEYKDWNEFYIKTYDLKTGKSESFVEHLLFASKWYDEVELLINGQR